MKHLNTENDYNRDSSDVLWSPDSNRITNSKLVHYMSWLKSERHLDFEGYHDLWQWSVDEHEEFWGSVWEYFNIGKLNDYSNVLSGSSIFDSKWFDGAKVNYCQNVFTKRRAA